eukprot:3507683-Amphidinium_carterae.1
MEAAPEDERAGAARRGKVARSWQPSQRWKRVVCQRLAAKDFSPSQQSGKLCTESATRLAGLEVA